MAGLADAAVELEALAFRLSRAGETELLREVTRAMRNAAGPAQDEIRAGLKPHLPDRYAEELDADLRLSVSVRTGDRNPGVSLTATTRSGQDRKLRTLDEGRLTHPVYGNRKVWVTQEEPSVKPGWFTGPAEAAGPRVRAAIERALADVAGKAARGG